LSDIWLKGTNPEKKSALIIGQNYPAMEKMIIPGFLKGLTAVDPGFQLDIRVLGNWYDAAKAAELSRSLYAQGADIILPICGSASQGAVRVAQETGKYLVFFDDDEFARAPDNILGCTVLHQEELAYRSLKAAIEEKTAIWKGRNSRHERRLHRILEQESFLYQKCTGIYPHKSRSGNPIDQIGLAYLSGSFTVICSLCSR